MDCGSRGRGGEPARAGTGRAGPSACLRGRAHRGGVGADGRISGVRHSWTFDEMYSAFAVPGAEDQAEYDELAKVNVKQLQEFNYFTVVRAGGRKPDVRGVRDATIVLDDNNKNVTLKFTVEFKEPASAGKAFVLQVFDPVYFIAFDFEKKDPVTWSMREGLLVAHVHAQALSDEDMKRLQDSAGTRTIRGCGYRDETVHARDGRVI